jgi:hypothetical protein
MVGLLLPFGFTAAILFLTAVGGIGFIVAVTMKNPTAST